MICRFPFCVGLSLTTQQLVSRMIAGCLKVLNSQKTVLQMLRVRKSILACDISVRVQKRLLYFISQFTCDVRIGIMTNCLCAKIKPWVDDSWKRDHSFDQVITTGETTEKNKHVMTVEDTAKKKWFNNVSSSMLNELIQPVVNNKFRWWINNGYSLITW